MIIFDSEPQFSRANKLKDEAGAQRINYSIYLQASGAFEVAHEQLKLELENSNWAVYKRQYANWQLKNLQFQSNDCLYDYYKLGKQFIQARQYLDKAYIIIAELENSVSFQIQLLSQDEEFDSTQYERFKAFVGYNFYSYKLKLNEFPAKQFFENKQYLPALKKYHDSLQSFDLVEQFLNANKTYLDDRFVINNLLNKAIVSLNYSTALISASNEHVYIEDSYYVVSIINQLLIAISANIEIIKIRPEDQMYQDGLPLLSQAISSLIDNHRAHWIEILDRFRNEGLIIEIMQTIDQTLYENTAATIPAESVQSYARVFLVHGFNTRGEWKNTLTSVLSGNQTGQRFIIEPFDYGLFVLRFILPWSREKAIKKFHDFYNNRLNVQYSFKTENHLVAHSFGTYITGSSLLRFPELTFDKIIYVGSILRRDFDWWNLKARKLNLRVHFEIQKKDFALFAAHLYSFIPWVNWLGDSGRKGLDRDYDFIEPKKYLHGGHSDMFGEQHMRESWMRFLNS